MFGCQDAVVPVWLRQDGGGSGGSSGGLRVWLGGGSGWSRSMALQPSSGQARIPQDIAWRLSLLCTVQRPQHALSVADIPLSGQVTFNNRHSVAAGSRAVSRRLW